MPESHGLYRDERNGGQFAEVHYPLQDIAFSISRSDYELLMFSPPFESLQTRKQFEANQLDVDSAGRKSPGHPIYFLATLKRTLADLLPPVPATVNGSCGTSATA